MASAVMSRKTLEVFAADHNCSKNNLAKSLTALYNKKIINDQLYTWADLLRLVGNSAAHDINPNISAQDSKDILDFTIAILDFVYSFKKKFDNFKIRKAPPK